MVVVRGRQGSHTVQKIEDVGLLSDRGSVGNRGGRVLALWTVACAIAGSVGTSALAVPETAWLPAESQLVVRVRYSDLGGSALFRRLMKSKPMFKEELAHVDRFITDAGIDPVRDLDSALIATDGRDRGDSVAVLAGQLRLKDLGPRLEKRGAAMEKRGAVVLYTLARSGAGGRLPGLSATVVAMPRDGAALIGTSAWVRLAVDRIEGRGQGAAGSATMGALLRRLDETATIWTAAGAEALSHQVASEWEDGQIDSSNFESVRNLVATFRIANDVRIDSEAAMATAGDADLLAVTLKGLIALGGFRMSGSDPELSGALRSLKVNRTTSGIRLTGQIPGPVAGRM